MAKMARSRAFADYLAATLSPIHTAGALVVSSVAPDGAAGTAGEKRGERVN